MKMSVKYGFSGEICNNKNHLITLKFHIHVSFQKMLLHYFLTDFKLIYQTNMVSMHMLLTCTMMKNRGFPEYKVK